MAPLSMTFLGAFAVSFNGRPLDPLRTTKAQALLIYLIIEAPTIHNRETLMELLWPGLPLPSAQVNLRQVLHQVRKGVPAAVLASDGETAVPCLLSDRKTVQLNPDYPVMSDVATFSRLLRRSRQHHHSDLLSCHDCQTWLEEAAALYQGDFLADFSLYDSNLYEAWAQTKREGLRRQLLDALDTLTLMTSGQGDYRRAEGYTRRQLQIDSYREGATRQLMRVLTLTGRRSEALAAYETCKQLLAADLGMAPAAKTTALYEQIRGGELSITIPVPRGIRGYDLGEIIGEGAFGAVHRAQQKGIEREVAIKIIQPQFANRPQFIRRFEAEAQIVARLEHPYIVPLYDYWREPDGAFLVMRWLRGGSLAAALAERPYDPEAAVTLIEQIAAALNSAHRQGVIHRDVKPSNILLDEEGNAFLSDFGIARQMERDVHLTASNELVGSPAYVSPEQLLKEAVTPATDIYSLGMVLYELLAGAKPFSTTSLAELIQKQMNETLPLIQPLRPELPKAVDDVIQQATAKKAADRFPDALTLAAAFRQATQKNGKALTVSATIAQIAEKDIVNPYLGLRPFQETDSERFFGRAALLERLLSRLATSSNLTPSQPVEGQGLGGGRFLAVVGPSGSGKSSVVKAGLIPALKSGGLPGSENWFMAEMMPGSHPLEELEAALMHVAVNPPASLLEPLQKDERGLTRVLKRVLPQDTDQVMPSQLLLVIDQFEELFTLVETEAARSHFIQNLLTALVEPASRLWLVITLRADFYDRPLRLAELGEYLRENTEVVLPLTAVELEEAITRPAAQVGVSCEPALVTTITADVNEQPGALPLVQYALTELFEQRDGRQLTLETYQKLGGVSGALARRAAEIYEGLDVNGQEMTRQLFLRLITLGEGVEDTRRRVRVSELGAMAVVGAQRVGAQRAVPLHAGAVPLHAAGTVEAVLAVYGRYRLLTFDRDPVTREPTVEVAHEALLREWRLLRSWLEESRADVRLQRLLAGYAAEWLGAEKDDGFLLRGARLDQFEGWLEETTLALTTDEQILLTTSLEARQQRKAAEEERRQRELETAQQLATEQSQRAEEQSRSARRLRWLVAGLAVILLLAVGAAWLAVDRGQEAQANAVRAANSEAEALILADERATALADADIQRLEAVDARATAVAEGSRADEERDAAQAAEAVAVQERVLAEASEREALEAYSLSLAANARQVLADDQQLALLLALAANQIQDPPLQSWQTLVDIAYAPAQVRQIETESIPIHLTVSPGGSRILSSHDDGSVQLRDVQTGNLLQRFDDVHPDRSGGLSFSPDGRQAISMGGGVTVLWDLERGEIVHRLDDQKLGRASAITPDGRRALLGGATESSPGELVVWDLESGEIIRRFGNDEEGPQEGVRAVAIAPDGRTALIGIGSTTEQSNANPRPLMLWDMETGVVIRYFEDVIRSVNGVDISPDGRLGIAASADGFVYVVDLDTGELVHKLEGHDIGPLDASFSPDGRTAISSAVDQTIIWWDIATGDLLQRFPGHEHIIWKAKFIDDTRAVSASLDGTLRIWDLTNSWQLNRWGTDGAGHQVDEQIYERDLLSDIFAVHSLAVSPDGQLAISGGGVDPSLLLWDYETGSILKRLEGHTNAVNEIVFAPDSRQALSASQDGSLILWDLQSGSQVRKLTGHKSPVLTVAISGDGRNAISGDEMNQIIYWDLVNGEIIKYLTGHMYGFDGSGVTDILFLHGDQQAVTSGNDGTLIVWDLASGQQVRRLTGFSGDVGSHWGDRAASVYSVSLSPDGRQIFTGGMDPLLLLWDLATGKSIRRYEGYAGWDVSLTPDGKRALSGYLNENLIVWDIDTGRPLRQYPINNRLQTSFAPAIAIHPNGQTALSSEPDGTILKWQLADPTPAELLPWLETNRHLRELTCLERETFQIEPLCVDGKAVSTSADLLVAVREATASLAIETITIANEVGSVPLVLTPPPYPEYQAVLGRNRGELDRYEFDVWSLEGKAGELLSIQMEADNPADDQTLTVVDFYEAGLLDPYLLIIAPDGSQLVYADQYTFEDGTMISTARLDHVLLPQDGTYRIEARSYIEESAGGYTLTVGLSQPIVVAPEILQEYAGTYLEGAWQSEILIYEADGRLHYQCLPCVDAGDTQVLVPISDNEFALIDDTRIVFTRDESGAVDGYDLWFAEKGWYAKTWHRAERIEE